MLKAATEGIKGDRVTHSGTRLANRHMIVYCSPLSGSCYKKAINEISGYESFLPNERTPGYEIFT